MATTGYDHHAIETQVRALWQEHDIYRYTPPTGGEPVFSLDTPPPYVSADHLHVGHAMSYSQPDFIARFRRMRGEAVFYPMGFDDNGLPTERYVEQRYGVRARDLPRAEFVALCLAETRARAADYETLWRRLGLSVDWSLRYSTIEPRCQGTAQAAFLTLYARGEITRREDPILWCPECQTALAQADVEDLARSGTLHELDFTGPAGQPLTIATTRPELLGACVALYCHPADTRYQALIGQTAAVPLTGEPVPIRADPQVDPAFGTGLMMVCTFGDSEDVARWRRDGLPLRMVVTADGRLSADGRLGGAAGELAGLPLAAARKQVVARLAEIGALRGSRQTRQVVGVHERCGTPVEFQIRPQWFVGVRAHAAALQHRAEALTWVPAHMRRRLTDWITGLRWDWNLSRQRHYGTPFPVWFCRGCAAPVVARRADLPVDPLTDPPPAPTCPECGDGLAADPDVMDTWFTSSLSPQINARWAERGYTLDPALAPMSLRIQGHEIIRTWLFYSLVQSHLLHDALPWQAAMISGWGLNEQGRKISKRELAGGDGFNRYDPEQVIEAYGADALRLWATKARVGTDLRYHEKDVRAGRKLAVKLWNVGRFLALHLPSTPPAPMPVEELTEVDKWLLSHLAETIDETTEALASYEVMAAFQAVSRFFWSIYCDRYLELVKGRFTDEGTPAGRTSAQLTLWWSFRAVLGLLAPFAPFITEHLYQHWYRPHESAVSLHLTRWPTAPDQWRVDRRTGDALARVLDAVRAQRSELRLGGGARVSTLVLSAQTAEATTIAAAISEPLRLAARAQQVRLAPAPGRDSGVPDLRVAVVP